MAKKKAAQSSKTETLLVELLTEELPPKSLKRLAVAFADAIHDYLKDGDFLEAESAFEAFATPRRLAARVSRVRPTQPDRVVERKGPSVQASFTSAGEPTQALLGFTRSCGITPEMVERHSDAKGEYVVYRSSRKGGPLAGHLSQIVGEALKRLPVAKLMRWGDGDAEFVRPVHGLVMMHGSKVVPGEILGKRSSNRSSGHRSLSKGILTIPRADQYEQALERAGRVIASFEKRRERIREELERKASGATIVYDDALLDEITALVEWPAVYEGTFDPDFLEVPPECLILSMQQHQKYVPLRDKKTGNLLPRFLFVSNIETKDPREIIHGNERVLRARLADAKFFYDQDRKERLDSRVPRLAKVIYHNKLGTQLERVERIQSLTEKIARDIGTDPELAGRAAWLSKADLLTGMVGEFPELQGIMGYHYARHDREPDAICDAIRDQYRTTREDTEPENLVSASLALADRIEALVGLFGVGEAPTGEKDPFALRRAALGIIRTFELIGASSKLAGKRIPDVRDFLIHAASLFSPGLLTSSVCDDVYEFILERCRNQLATVFPKDTIEAVISQRPKLVEINARVQAVQSFRKLPQADNLAAANKRIRNILRKSEAADANLNESLLREPEERALLESVQKIEPKVHTFIQAGQFAEALQATATVEPSVNAFFDKVLVNAEDPGIRANRHALLRQKLHPFLNQVADISKLAVEK